jgi:hypothetical protein
LTLGYVKILSVWITLTLIDIHCRIHLSIDILLETATIGWWERKLDIILADS